MKTILQVEDDPNDVFLLKHAMKKAGVTNPTQIASDGQLAIDYLSGAGKFADEVLRLTDGVGVQVVYDGTGAESFEDSLRVVDFHGTLALYGPLFDQPMPPFNLWRLPKSIKMTYPIVMHHVRTRDRLIKYSTQLFDWVRAGKLTVKIGHRYPLADAAQAHSDIHSRRTTGKLLLLPRF